MGKCPDCPLWIAIEGACEISDGFEKGAVDNPNKPGALVQTRNRTQRAVFKSIENRIKCDYTTDDEPVTQPLAIEVVEQTDEPAPAEQEIVDLDADEAEVVEATEESAEGGPMQMDEATKAAFLQAFIRANTPKVMGCLEPFKLELPMFTLANGMTVGPDGYVESPEARTQRPTSGGGQYL